MITKDEYLLKNFSKIKHKKWELLVVISLIFLSKLLILFTFYSHSIVTPHESLTA